MTTSELINEICGPLAKAQGEFAPAVMDAVNPHFRSKFAPLRSIMASVRPALAKHGLAVVQAPSTANGCVTVTTRIVHDSGQWLEDALTLPLGERATPQAVGSLITYIKRYALAAMLGVVAEEDDDGALAEEHAVKSPSTAIQQTVRAMTNPEANPGHAIKWQGRIEKVDAKPGTASNGRAYVRYAVTINGQLASTFDEKLAESAKALQKLEADVTAEVRPGKRAGTFDLMILEEDLPL